MHNTENEMKWGQAVQRGTQPSLTGCLAPSLSVIVASVWWICSHPVRGGYREKCFLSVRWGRCELCRRKKAGTGRYGPCESLWSTVNWSLWGQGPWPWGRRSTGYRFLKSSSFFFYFGCRESGSKWYPELSKKNQKPKKPKWFSLSCAAVSNILNH